MAIVNSYVKLPEGILTSQEERVCDGCFDLLQHDKGRPVNEQFLKLKRIEARIGSDTIAPGFMSIATGICGISMVIWEYIYI